LDLLLKVEVVRLDAIPYVDSASRTTYTPLECVDRVVALTTEVAPGSRTPVRARLDMQVHGLGQWTTEIPMFVDMTPPTGQHPA
jgi:hypothetical protein